VVYWYAVPETCLLLADLKLTTINDLFTAGVAAAEVCMSCNEDVPLRDADYLAQRAGGRRFWSDGSASKGWRAPAQVASWLAPR
jgi:hypothetical protein